MKTKVLEAAQRAAGEVVLGGEPGVFVSSFLSPESAEDRFAVEGLLLLLRDRLPAGDAVLRAERVDVGGYGVLVLTMGVLVSWPSGRPVMSCPFCHGFHDPGKFAVRGCPERVAG